jgi:hypothetical protein
MPLTLTRSLLVVLVPGIVGVAPWLLFAVRSWPDLKTTYAQYTVPANAILFAVVVLLGSVFEGLATIVEVRWDKEREKAQSVKESWYAYLARTCPEPPGHRYLSRMFTTLYFELTMLSASVVFLIGAAVLVWLSNVDQPLRWSLSILGIAVAAVLYFRWQARSSHLVLCEVRRELAARLPVAPPPTAGTKEQSPAEAAHSPLPPQSSPETGPTAN